MDRDIHRKASWLREYSKLFRPQVVFVVHFYNTGYVPSMVSYDLVILPPFLAKKKKITVIVHNRLSGTRSQRCLSWSDSTILQMAYLLILLLTLGLCGFSWHPVDCKTSKTSSWNSQKENRCSQPEKLRNTCWRMQHGNGPPHSKNSKEVWERTLTSNLQAHTTCCAQRRLRISF